MLNGMHMVFPWRVLHPGETFIAVPADSSAASAATTRQGTPVPWLDVTPGQHLVPARPDEPSALLVRPTSPAPKPRTPSPVPKPSPRRRPRTKTKPKREPAEPPRAPFSLRTAEAPATAPARRQRFRHLKGAQATDESGRFGLHEEARDMLGMVWVRARLKRRGDPETLARIRLGEALGVVSRTGDRHVTVRVLALGRSGYFAPGRKVTSLMLGLDATEWAQAQAGDARGRGGI